MLTARALKAGVLTFPLQLELPVSAGVCHPQEAGWTPASKTGPKGLAAAAVPALTQTERRAEDSGSQ